MNLTARQLCPVDSALYSAGHGQVQRLRVLHLLCAGPGAQGLGRRAPLGSCQEQATSGHSCPAQSPAATRQREQMGDSTSRGGHPLPDLWAAGSWETTSRLESLRCGQQRPLGVAGAKRWCLTAHSNPAPRYTCDLRHTQPQGCARLVKWGWGQHLPGRTVASLEQPALGPSPGPSAQWASPLQPRLSRSKMPTRTQ